jgi:hypothetical protein
MPDKTTTPGTGRASGIDSAELGLPPIAGAAPLRFASSAHGESGGDAGVARKPAAKIRKNQSPRRIDASRYPSLGAVNAAQKNGLPNLSQS